jgi:hypothetical protein
MNREEIMNTVGRILKCAREYFLDHGEIIPTAILFHGGDLVGNTPVIMHRKHELSAEDDNIYHATKLGFIGYISHADLAVFLWPFKGIEFPVEDAMSYDPTMSPDTYPGFMQTSFAGVMGISLPEGECVSSFFAYTECPRKIVEEVTPAKMVMSVNIKTPLLEGYNLGKKLMEQGIIPEP